MRRGKLGMDEFLYITLAGVANMTTAKVVLAVLTVLAFDGLGIHVASAPAQGTSPTALQVIQSELSSLPQWSHYLPDDIDANNDGELSVEEVGEKVKSYMSEVFNQLDKDSNQVVIQDEVKKASLDVDFINKIVDIAFKSYPIKNYLGHGDRNQDGFISEDDFYIAENNRKMNLEDAQKHCGGECEYDYNDYNIEVWSLSSSYPVYGEYYSKTPVCEESFGEKAADVFCRELGFKGVESLSSVSFDEYKETANERDLSRYFDPYKSKFDCQGSESKLEECSKSEVDDSDYYKRGGDGYYNRWSKEENCPFGRNRLASVTCAFETEIGPIHLAGGKVASIGELHIGDKSYKGEVSQEMAQVVCRQLGFTQGTPKIIRDSIFFGFNHFVPKFEKKFECTGSEAKLGDCSQTLLSRYDYWRIDAIDCNPGEDLDEKYGWIDQQSFFRQWEFWGRRLLIADTNGDEKVSVEELKVKVKEIIEAVFHLLDQTNDGSFSVEDVSTLSLRLPDVIDVLDKLFEFMTSVTGGKGEFDPAFFIGPIGDSIGDSNGRITLKEIKPLLDSSQDEGLLLLLSKYLDSNQDGLVQSTELENYVKMIFNNLDVDDSSTITLDDVFKFMKKSQFTCLQIEGVEMFVEGWMELIETQVGKLLDYFFTYLDLDSNGEIPLDEFYNLPVCNQMDPNDPRACRNLEKFFYFDERPLVPNMKYKGDGLRLQRGEEKDVQEKLVNAFCIAMQPDF